MNKRLIKSNDEGGGGNASFNTVLYTGTGTTNPRTDIGFQPDLVWIKNRTNTNSNVLQDSVRGANQYLISNTTNAEATRTDFQSFDSNGFTVTGNNDSWNGSHNYVAWCWKAGGAAVTNTDGTITSQVSANTEAGFSIVSWTGNGNASSIGHGLSSAPDMIILKNRTDVDSWEIHHKSITPITHSITFTTSAARLSNYFTAKDLTTFSVGGYNRSNGLNDAMIAYCFAEVAGFSKFGSYDGTGTASGNVVVTGFEPAFVMVKRTDASGGSWLMVDNKRVAAGNEKHELFANTSTAESGTGYDVAFLENGFQMQTTTSNANASGASYIYMAFANQF